jgi:hypothetical protein
VAGVHAGPGLAQLEAEDFVIAESLQLRNLHVYLNAAIWADWAQTAQADR